MCSLHFSREDYENIGQFEAGFASRLVLKAGAVPRLFGEPDVPLEKVAAASQRTSDRAKRVARRHAKQVFCSFLVSS